MASRTFFRLDYIPAALSESGLRSWPRKKSASSFAKQGLVIEPKQLLNHCFTVEIALDKCKARKKLCIFCNVY